MACSPPARHRGLEREFRRGPRPRSAFRLNCPSGVGASRLTIPLCGPEPAAFASPRPSWAAAHGAKSFSWPCSASIPVSTPSIRPGIRPTPPTCRCSPRPLPSSWLPSHTCSAERFSPGSSSSAVRRPQGSSSPCREAIERIGMVRAGIIYNSIPLFAVSLEATLVPSEFITPADDRRSAHHRRHLLRFAWRSHAARRLLSRNPFHTPGTNEKASLLNGRAFFKSRCFLSWCS